MRTYPCSCGNPLFYDSHRCVSCELPTAMCPECSQIVPYHENSQGTFKCGNDKCNCELRMCSNVSSVIACNRATQVDDPTHLCEFCRTTSLVPDLSVAGNGKKWRRLEKSKQRVLQTLKEIGFQLNSTALPLSFEFKADAKVPVTTGHVGGCITINIREADSVEREKSRIELGEPQRTLVGHFRHELGHYYWDLLVKDRRISDFRKVFGDESQPPYDVAMKRYYANGATVDWVNHFISPYATMHPWEDFAETFGAYLDMQSVMSTAMHFGFAPFNEQPLEISSTISNYSRLGMAVNELNRDMGLTDLVPEVFNASVIKKLEFVDQLRTTDL